MNYLFFSPLNHLRCISGREHLWGLFELSVDAGLQLLKKRVKMQHLAVPYMSVVQTLCRIMSALISFMNNHGGFGDPDVVSIAYDYLHI